MESASTAPTALLTLYAEITHAFPAEVMRRPVDPMSVWLMDAVNRLIVHVARMKIVPVNGASTVRVTTVCAKRDKPETAIQPVAENRNVEAASGCPVDNRKQSDVVTISTTTATTK